MKARLNQCTDAMIRPYSRWLSEDYFIFHVSEASGNPSAADVIRDH